MTQRISVYTLVDITETGISRVCDNNRKEYYQQQNLNVLLQTIGLRTQAFEIKVQTQHNVGLADYDFGNHFVSDQANVWRLDFVTEIDHVWSDGKDELALLKTDVHGVAITADLDDSEEFSVNIFDVFGNINIYFDCAENY